MIKSENVKRYEDAFLNECQQKGCLIKESQILLLLKQLNIQPNIQELNMILKLLLNDQKVISISQFIYVCSLFEQKNPLEDKYTMFMQKYNKDGSGLNQDELKNMFFLVGERVTDEQIQQLIDQADKDGDGKIGQQDLITAIRK